MNMLYELFGDVDWLQGPGGVNGQKIVDEAYIRHEFEVLTGLSSNALWGYKDKHGYSHYGRGVLAEESLQVINKILAKRSGTDKQYKLIEPGWDWDFAFDSDDMKDYLDKGPIFFMGNVRGYPHAVALLREDDDGNYILADSLKNRPVNMNEERIEEYIKLPIKIRGSDGEPINSTKRPMLVPAW